MPLPPGTRLGPYEIAEPPGAGGMGEVYRARDTRLGRDVALKVPAGHLTEHPEVRARFEREAKTVSSLNHPHICTLFDVGGMGHVHQGRRRHRSGRPVVPGTGPFRLSPGMVTRPQVAGGAVCGYDRQLRSVEGPHVRKRQAGDLPAQFFVDVGPGDQRFLIGTRIDNTADERLQVVLDRPKLLEGH